MRCMLCLTVALIIPSISLAQDAAPPTPKPQKEHEYYKQDAGVWEGDMTIYEGTPDGTPMVIPAKETCELWGNGFWLMTTFESGPFQGRGQFGYDPLKKKYVGSWTDNMSPHMALWEGNFADDKETMTMYSKGVDPQSGKVQAMKSETKHVKKNERLFTMYSKKGDDWVKSFEMKLKRVK